jgi:uncharacterized phiE125 gp8 family phage protein
VAIEVIDHPESFPISIELLKQHLRIIGSDDDNTLQNLYLPAAVDAFTAYTKRALIETRVKQTFDTFPCERYFLLERAPLIELEEFRFADSDGWSTVVDSDLYYVTSSSPAKIVLNPNKQWPKTREGCENVQLIYTCGYGEDDDYVPYSAKQALSMLVGDMFLHREDSIALPGIVVAQSSWDSKSLMNQYKLNFYEHASQSRR